MPGEPCLWCMSLLTDALLTDENRNYGQAGDRPQVIWPNGMLASTAVGIFMQLVTPWHDKRLPILVEYDGNTHEILPREKLSIPDQKTCTHYTGMDLGDSFFKI